MNLPNPLFPTIRMAIHAWLLAVMLPCLPGIALAEAFIEGTALYRERMALPPGAVFEATLEEVSVADRAAAVLGRVSIAAPGNPPIHFRIPYAENEIAPGHRYSVRARIREGERLLFTTDQLQPVLTQNQNPPVDLLLRRVGGATPPRVTPQAAQPGLAPGSYLGDLPCADCPGIHYQVDLLPDGVFYRRMVYQDRDVQVDSVGRWLLVGEPKMLVLRDGAIQPERYAVKGNDTLRMLDGEGHEIFSGLNYDLKRAPAFQPIEPQGELSGLYRYLADAGRFVECVTGLSLPVAQEAANAQLEAAYSRATRKTPGQPLFVKLDGALSPRPKMEGDGQETALVVQRVLKLGPGDSCPIGKAPDYR